HRLQVLESHSGKFVRTWGRQGTQEGEFAYPLVTTYFEGLVVVGDELCVQVFSQEGVFYQKIGKRGKAPGEFHRVWGLQMDRNRKQEIELFVSDCMNFRIQVFNS